MFTFMKTEELYLQFSKSSGVSTDSRKIFNNCIFFALKGENFNGNKFAKDALKKGAQLAVIDDQKYFINEKTILVNDVLKSLQQLANYHRKQLTIPFIGITGSNGKTTSKELINAVLSKKYNTHFTQGNLNNQIGVPLTLLSIPKNCEIAIIEMGASHQGDIKELCKIADPNFGIITNIGIAHIEGFGSKEGIIKTKNEMYEYIFKNKGLLFTNNDDELLKLLTKNYHKYTYGKTNADCTAQLVSSSPTLTIHWKNNTINSSLYGEYNFYNILLAICVGLYFKLTTQQIISGIEDYVSSNNRSQLISLQNHQIFLDAYNANPSSMNAAIDSFQHVKAENKIVILGDMLELGNISSEEHQKIINKVNSLKINGYFVGNEFLNAKEKYHFTYFQNTQELIDFLTQNKIPHSSLLIKGSRGIGLEKIIDFIEK